MFHARTLFFGEHPSFPKSEISENEASLALVVAPSLNHHCVYKSVSSDRVSSAQFGADSRRFLYLQGPWGEKNTAAKLIIRCGS